MNYLAHLLLADDSDASRIGNLLGDFTKGTIASLAEIYPSEVVRGIKMHRAVDRFTDSHPLFKNTRQLLAPERRRFSGIIIDIIFDHFLSVHWVEYHHQPLESFVQDIYRAIDDHPEWQAGRLAKTFPMMRHENWLQTYTTIDGIALTLERVSHRGKRTAPIAEGIIDLQENHADFEANFHAFMPSLLEFTDSWKKEH